jgi:hypothetical protein
MNFQFRKGLNPFKIGNLEFHQRIQIQTYDFKPRAFFKIKGKDFNFKRIFSPIDLNLIYFIELKGRFQMEIGSNFE